MSGGLTSPPIAVPPARRRLGGIVETYVRKKLPRDVHPAFKAVRDRDEAVAGISQTQLQSGMQLALVGQDESLQISPPSSQDDDEFSLEEMYKDAESEKLRFEIAMESYENTTAGSKFKTDVTCRSMHTWEEVLVEINKASESYKNVPGLWGKVRRCFRRFGQNNKAFTAWSTLLPSGSEYFSILCGGMKLIIGAAARMHDLRQDICDALAEIPILLLSTHRALALFRKSRNLHQCSSALYVATIAALHHIVLWYKEKAYKKIARSLFKQDSYGEELQEMLKTIRKQSELFDRLAQLCSYEISLNTNDEVKSHRIEAYTNHTVVVEMLNQLREICVDFLSSNPRIDPISRDR